MMFLQNEMNHTGAFSGSVIMSTVIRPQALRAGDTLGIVAPSSWAKARNLRKGVAHLERSGYRVKLYCSPRLMYGYLAGPDRIRARLLERAFADPAVKAIVCERGGYGALRMVDQVDFSLIRRHPKIFVGFSDITVLHMAMATQANLTTFYGPMVAFSSPAYTWRSLWRALSDARAAGPVALPAGSQPTFLRPGRATGRVFGGTLSLISKLVGTRYLPELKGAILFLEDVDEKPYKIDGYLAHLRLAGVLDRIGGLVLANFKNCRPRRNSLSLAEIFRDYFGRARYPVALDMPFGHLGPMFTLPLGVRATLDSRIRNLSLEESGVR